MVPVMVGEAIYNHSLMKITCSSKLHVSVLLSKQYDHWFAPCLCSDGHVLEGGVGLLHACVKMNTCKRESRV